MGASAFFPRLMALCFSMAALSLAPASAAAAGGLMLAQSPPPPQMMESCPGLIASRPVPLPVQLKFDEVRISYVGHSTFLIESPQRVRIATDYNDYVRPQVLPDIVTMNRAHSTHYTNQPDPAIRHVLRGWDEGERPARHDVQVKDVRVRNVPTNIRTWGGDTERHGNSIFVFEVANLCIAHLGHLHHTLTQQQLNEIGRVDIALVPVDGTYTLDLEGMMEVLKALKPQMVIPMHYFSAYTLNGFLEQARALFEVETNEVPTIVVSKTTLPPKPKVLVLPGR